MAEIDGIEGTVGILAIVGKAGAVGIFVALTVGGTPIAGKDGIAVNVGAFGLAPENPAGGVNEGAPGKAKAYDVAALPALANVVAILVAELTSAAALLNAVSMIDAASAMIYSLNNY